MKDIFIVTKFTMKDMMKRKSFIISTLIILALIVIGFNIPIFGIDMMRKKRNIEDLESIEYFQEKYDSIRPSFFKLTDILRTDYHKSNKTIKEFNESLDELKKKDKEETKKLINDMLEHLYYSQIEELSKKYDLYRQDYCGCEFSKH